MKNTWIFFALVPLFSYAAIQEEWLLESYRPLELQQEKPLEKRNDVMSDQKIQTCASQTKEYRLEKTRRYKKSAAVLQDKNSRRTSRKAQRQHPIDEHGQEMVLSSHLEPLPTSKEQPTKSLSGLHIETNRKPERHAYLTQESMSDAVKEQGKEQEADPKENSVKRKSGSAVRNSRRLQ